MDEEQLPTQTFLLVGAIVLMIATGTVALASIPRESDPFFRDAPGRRLSDADVAAIANRYEVREQGHGRLRLGVHRGVMVIDETTCGDLCPDYTVHIIRYDVEAGPSCDDAGGVSAEMMIPWGDGLDTETFCLPAPLVAARNRLREGEAPSRNGPSGG